MPKKDDDLLHSYAEVIERLCKLKSKVWDVLQPNCATPCDCICEGQPKTYQDGFRHTGEVLTFIEQAVEEKLQRHLDSAPAAG